MTIHGLQKLTLLDFPGRVACTVFLAGCNLRCPFCHNSELLDAAAAEPVMDDAALLDFLKKRQGMLDGVAFTGGEPLLRADLPELMARVRDLGYAVKLDTNGCFPDALARVLDAHLADYVAMDVKNSPARYAETCGVEEFDMAPVYASIALLHPFLTASQAEEQALLKPSHIPFQKSAVNSLSILSASHETGLKSHCIASPIQPKNVSSPLRIADIQESGMRNPKNCSMTSESPVPIPSTKPPRKLPMRSVMPERPSEKKNGIVSVKKRQISSHSSMMYFLKPLTASVTPSMANMRAARRDLPTNLNAPVRIFDMLRQPLSARHRLIRRCPPFAKTENTPLPPLMTDHRRANALPMDARRNAFIAFQAVPNQPTTFKSPLLIKPNPPFIHLSGVIFI